MWHSKDVIRTRRLKKAARRKFFIFMAEDLRETSHKTVYLLTCETPNGFVFAQSAACMFCENARQTFFLIRQARDRIRRRATLRRDACK
ncbi:MAG: hypothetical protein DME70_06310 [Verrucomicrobia bacterium]|nr:MAG: hypothetical protein DME70_06310 [Verrucomicrobiota bacterium]